MRGSRFSLVTLFWITSVVSLALACYVVDSRAKEMAVRANQAAKHQGHLQWTDLRSLASRHISAGTYLTEKIFRIYSPASATVKLVAGNGPTAMVLDECETVVEGEYVVGLELGVVSELKRSLILNIYQNGIKQRTYQMKVPERFKPPVISYGSDGATKHSGSQGYVELCTFTGGGAPVTVLVSQ
jgi:hypothetical protein